MNVYGANNPFHDRDLIAQNDVLLDFDLHRLLNTIARNIFPYSHSLRPS